MAIVLDGTSGINTPNTFGYKNLLIDAGFTINQRAYVSGATLASGSYGHDRWKAGASGGNYTFTQLASSTTITIASGKSLIQVIEDKNVNGTSFVLSWTGTAQARYAVNSATPSGSYAASPIVITGQTVGTTMSVEFNEGTLSKPQLELGAVATSFDVRDYGRELAMCQRYFERWDFGSSNGFIVTGQAYSTTVVQAGLTYTIQKRAAPTIATSGTTTNYSATGSGTASTYVFGQITSSTAIITGTTSLMVAGNASLFYMSSANSFISFSAEL
jgi:hypothetical protein